MSRYLTVGLAAVAGAALIEAALIPGLVIGGAAVLAPKILPDVLPGLRRGLQSLTKQNGRSRPKPANTPADRIDNETPAFVPAKLEIKQAIAKTITFRIIVTTLDFTSNYIVIGELTTAAGLSTFALVVGPLFYLAHETAWNYFDSSETVDVSALLRARSDDPQSAHRSGFTISRALAKTITFRTIATAMDFTASYVAVGDALTAAGLAAFGFVVGPFVYYGHEKAWDYFSSGGERVSESGSALMLPSPEKT